MSITSEISRLTAAKASLKAVLNSKLPTASITDEHTLDDYPLYASLIRSATNTDAQVKALLQHDEGSFIIPEGTESIGSYAFYNCNYTAISSIPDSVTQIGSRAFYGCTRLGFTHIKNVSAYSSAYALASANLTTITLGDTLSPVISIVATTFSQNPGLLTINIYTTSGQVLPLAPFGAINATINYYSAATGELVQTIEPA